MPVNNELGVVSSERKVVITEKNAKKQVSEEAKVRKREYAKRINGILLKEIFLLKPKSKQPKAICSCRIAKRKFFV